MPTEYIQYLLYSTARPRLPRVLYAIRGTGPLCTRSPWIRTACTCSGGGGLRSYRGRKFRSSLLLRLPGPSHRCEVRRGLLRLERRVGLGNATVPAGVDPERSTEPYRNCAADICTVHQYTELYFPVRYPMCGMNESRMLALRCCTIHSTYRFQKTERAFHGGCIKCGGWTKEKGGQVGNPTANIQQPTRGFQNPEPRFQIPDSNSVSTEHVRQQ